MSETKQPYNDGHTHEALHTVHVLLDTFENHVAESLCAEQFPEVKLAANKVADDMARLYQLIGSKWLALTPSSPGKE